MSGLFYKDLLVIKKDLILSGIGILFFSLPLFLPWKKILEASQISPEVLSAEGMTYVFLPLFVYFAVFETVAAVQGGIFSHDERKVWRSFVMASPSGVRGQVFSKYAITLALSLTAFLWGCVCDTICVFTSGTAGSAAPVYASLLLIQIVLRAFELPFLIRFGQKHGRAYKILIFVLMFFAGIVYLLFGKIPDSLSVENGLDFILHLREGQGISPGLLLLFFCAAMFLYSLSFWVSCKLYRRGAADYEV